MSRVLWTESQLAEYRRKRGAGGQGAEPAQPEPTPRKQAGPNKTERAYMERCLLELQSIGAEVRFQPMRLYLSNGHSYRPDWGVFWPDGLVELHEVKGPFVHSRDSRILFDTARRDFPAWCFVWAQRRKGGEWHIQRFHNGGPAA